MPIVSYICHFLITCLLSLFICRFWGFSRRLNVKIHRLQAGFRQVDSRNRQHIFVLFHIEEIKVIQIKPLSRLFCPLSTCLSCFDHRHRVDWCIYDRGPDSFAMLLFSLL